MFSAALLGSAAGGFLAEYLGCRMVFRLSRILILVAGTCILLLVRERHGTLAGIIAGRLADRLPPARVAWVAAVGSGLLMLPQGFTGSLTVLYVAHFGAVLFGGALGDCRT